MFISVSKSALSHLCKNIYIYIYIYIVMAKNIGTLGKYDQRRQWKWICIVNPFDKNRAVKLANEGFKKHWIKGWR